MYVAQKTVTLWSFTSTVVVLVAMAVATSWSQSTERGSTTERDMRASPLRTYAARLEFPKSPTYPSRAILIHRCDPTAKTFNRYFHRPLWVSLPNQQVIGNITGENLQSLDSFVWSSVPASREGGDKGDMRLQFRFQLSSEAIRQAAGRVVVIDDAQFLAESLVDPKNVDVSAWPIIDAVVELIDVTTGNVLCSTRTDSLSSLSDEVDLYFSFDKALLDKARALHRSNHLAFRCSHRFSNLKSGFVSSVTEIDVQIDAKKALVFSKYGQKSLTLKNAQDVLTDVRIALNSRVVVSDQTLLPFYTSPDLSLDHYFDRASGSLATLLGENAADDKIASFMAPVTETIKRALNENGMESDEFQVTANSSRDSESGANFGVNWKVVNFGVSGASRSKSTTDAVDKVRRQHGFVLDWSEEKSAFSLQGVDVYHLKNAVSDEVGVSRSDVIVGLGPAYEYFEETPVPSNYYATGFEMSLASGAEESGYDGVPIGTVLPFFGDAVPRGYVLADGQSSWPDELWVPRTLRNRPVPDLRSSMLGGSPTFEAGTKGFEESIGSKYSSGKIDVSAARIPEETIGQSNKFDHILSVDDTKRFTAKRDDKLKMFITDPKVSVGYGRSRKNERPPLNASVSTGETSQEVHVRKFGDDSNSGDYGFVTLRHLEPCLREFKSKNLVGSLPLNSPHAMPNHWRVRYIIKFR